MVGILLCEIAISMVWFVREGLRFAAQRYHTVAHLRVPPVKQWYCILQLQTHALAMNFFRGATDEKGRFASKGILPTKDVFRDFTPAIHNNFR